MKTDEGSERSDTVDFENGESGAIRQGMPQALTSGEKTGTRIFSKSL